MPAGLFLDHSEKDGQFTLEIEQDVVAASQEEKCGLKYVIHSPD